ncbi:PREDICTED: AT-hook-containing transcription factor [Ficedula albicollis]|uniref:AT-hook-containing transcription factor n=1 Tax=Ficedula albicollis TaxID=59894 RepID=UPI0007AD8D7D|nr:PREDICTED: AT-hook-containing transcription factor [Ficedula albicollis]
MASPAPWLRWTQTEQTRWQGEGEGEGEDEEEEEEEDDFERRMDEDGVIGLGEGARSPPWGREWTPSLALHLSPDEPSPERVPEPQTAGTGMPAPGTAALAPTGQPQGAGGPPAPQRHDRSRVPEKAAPAAVPPKPARQSRSLSPRRRTGGKGTRDPSGTGTEGTQYGRGRLNHPLPDLSKVEARVKFDQSYRPPRGRVLPARPRGPGRPIGFKSPAEIVREVLLSSGEGASPQPPSTGLPQEFRSPRQATALVQQLQDDYHKLLTKYAEAENTIDQLRLGARVSLFSDPPQPSRSLAMGTVASGSRVMTFSIPQARTAALGMATAPASPGTAAAPGPSERGGSPQPRSPPLPGVGCPTCPGPCCCPGPRLTRALAGQSRRLQAQARTGGGWGVERCRKGEL